MDGFRRTAQHGRTFGRDLERIWQMRADNSNAAADPVGIARWIRLYTSRNKWKHLREQPTARRARCLTDKGPYVLQTQAYCFA